MKSGTLCVSVEENYAPSLYRDKSDFDRYYWSGLTPNHSHGALPPKTTVMFVEEVVWDGQLLAKIVHGGKTFYIESHYIQKV